MAHLQDIDFKTLVSNFELFSRWEEKYQYLLDLAKKLPPFPEQYRTEENRIHGCQSQVWMHMSWSDDTHPIFTFDADSDAFLVRGIIAVLFILFTGKSKSEILGMSPMKELEKLDLQSHLSPTRNNGLHAMVSAIETAAKNV